MVEGIFEKLRQAWKEECSRYEFDEQRLYVRLQIGVGHHDDDPKDALEVVESFLSESSQGGLLLLGNSGHGKSLFSHWLVAHLWERWERRDLEFIPLFVLLTGLKIDKDWFAHWLEAKCKLTGEEINELRQQKLFVVCDGYDELGEDFAKKNISQYLGLQWQIKIMITCRTEALVNMDDSKRDNLFAPPSGTLIKWVTQDFKPGQINDYIRRYIDARRKITVRGITTAIPVANPVEVSMVARAPARGCEIPVSTPHNVHQGLQYQSVIGDGNCLYRAVSYYIDRGGDVSSLRSKVAANFGEHAAWYAKFIPLRDGQSIQDYIAEVRTTRAWAGEVEINILMELLQRPIVIIGVEGTVRNRDAVEKYRRQEPIFVYYNGGDDCGSDRPGHYDALILRPGYDGGAILAAVLDSSGSSRVEQRSSADLPPVDVSSSVGARTIAPCLSELEQREDLSFDDYQKALNEIRGLKDLIINPFLLTIVVAEMSNIIQRYEIRKAAKRDYLTYMDVYDVFTAQWFARQKNKLLEQGAINDSQAITIERDFRDYAMRIAVQLWQLGETVIHCSESSYASDTPPSGTKSPYLNRFASTAPRGSAPSVSAATASRGDFNEFFATGRDFDGQTQNLSLAVVRYGCPLRQIGKDEYEFIHNSLLEYFVCGRILFSLKQDDNTILGQELNGKLLNSKPAIIRNIATMVQDDSSLADKLRAVVEESKCNQDVSIAAANAMTILVMAQVPFSGQDLKYIRIKGADLSGGIFDGTDLTGADLRDTTMRGVWLRGANLSQCCMDNVNFGELPSVTWDRSRESGELSSDGRLLAVGGDGNVRILEVSSGKELRCLVTDMRASSLRFSPDGRLLAVERCLRGVHGEHKIHIWKIATGRELCHLKMEEGFTDFCFSPDGRFLVTHKIMYYSVLQIWEVASGKELFHLLLSNNVLKSPYNFSPDSSLLAVLENGGTVRILEVASGKELYCLQTGGARYCLFSPNGRLLVSGGRGKTVQIWDATSWNRLYSLNGGFDRTPCQFSSDSRLLACLRRDKKTVRIFDIANDGRLLCVFNHDSDVSSYDFSPDNKLLAPLDSKGTIRIWDIANGRLRASLSCGRYIKGFNFSPDSKKLFLLTVNACDCWEIAEENSLNRLPEHNDVVLNRTLLFSGNLLVPWEAGQAIQIWEVSGNREQQFPITRTTREKEIWVKIRDGVECLSGRELLNDPDHALFYQVLYKIVPEFLSVPSSSFQHELIRVKHEINQYGNEDVQCSFSPNNNLLALLFGNSIQIWKVTRSSLLPSKKDDKNTRIWEIVVGERLGYLQGHEYCVTSCSFSADGKLLVSGSIDKNVRIWHIATKQCIYTLDVFSGKVRNVKYQNDLLVVASGGVTYIFKQQISSQQDASFVVTLRLWRTIATGFLPLYVEGASFDQVTGLSDSNERLLRQRKARVSVSRDRSEDVLARLDAVVKITHNEEAVPYYLLNTEASGALLKPNKDQWVVGIVRRTGCLYLFACEHTAEKNVDDRFSFLDLKGPTILRENFKKCSKFYYCSGEIKDTTVEQKPKWILLDSDVCSSIAEKFPGVGEEAKVLYPVPKKIAEDLARKTSHFSLSYLRHVFMIIEGIEDNFYHIRRVDLFADYNNTVRTRRGTEMLHERAVIKISDKSVESTKLLLRMCFARVFIISAKQGRELLKNIRMDQESEITYWLAGNGILYNREGKERKHNCLSWCEEQCEKIGIEKIREQRFVLFDFFAVNPRYISRTRAETLALSEGYFRDAEGRYEPAVAAACRRDTSAAAKSFECRLL